MGHVNNGIEGAIKNLGKIFSKYLQRLFGDTIAMSLRFYGEIRNVQYRAFLTEELPEYNFDGFNINETGTYGKIVYKGGEIAFR